ncbi:hypothetical protein SAMN05216231_0902 [Virgibacillus salinus]|uniref:Uncharacterized protein n=1 Tax=Virgibacillus salinus TaxID=553311 RepID=A0A1H0YX36_9BACI|nr:hypothetical protein SAMN05216231_0902 [Virgibacillus salinus]
MIIVGGSALGASSYYNNRTSSQESGIKSKINFFLKDATFFVSRSIVV